MKVDTHTELSKTVLSTDSVTATFGMVCTPKQKSPGACYTFEHSVQVRDIVQAVSLASGICEQDLLGPRRARQFARPRQLAMFICRERCHHLSLPVIGRCLGDRHHTTVMYGAKIAEHMITIDQDLLYLYHRSMRNLVTRDQAKKRGQAL